MFDKWYSTVFWVTYSSVAASWFVIPCGDEVGDRHLPLGQGEHVLPRVGGSGEPHGGEVRLAPLEERFGPQGVESVVGRLEPPCGLPPGAGPGRHQEPAVRVFQHRPEQRGVLAGVTDPAGRDGVPGGVGPVGAVRLAAQSLGVDRQRLTRPPLGFGELAAEPGSHDPQISTAVVTAPEVVEGPGGGRQPSRPGERFDQQGLLPQPQGLEPQTYPVVPGPGLVPLPAAVPAPALGSGHRLDQRGQ